MYTITGNTDAFRDFCGIGNQFFSEPSVFLFVTACSTLIIALDAAAIAWGALWTPTLSRIVAEAWMNPKTAALAMSAYSQRMDISA